MELEEKVKKLQEEFKSLPKLLIKKTLCSDDVNGDLVKASQRLQEFAQINNSSLNNPVATKPMVGVLSEGLHDSSQGESDNMAGNRLPSRIPDSPSSTPSGRSSRTSHVSSIKDTAFKGATSFQNSDNGRNLGRVFDSTMMSKQSTETTKNTKRRAPDPPKPKPNQNSEKNTSSDSSCDNGHKLGMVIDSTMMIIQSAETTKKTKRRAPHPPKPKPKPNWRRDPGKKQFRLLTSGSTGKFIFPP